MTVVSSTQMFEEGQLWASRGASAFHHQSGAVRATLSPTGHRLRHHVRSAGTVCWYVSECVFVKPVDVEERKIDSTHEQDKCEIRCNEACSWVIQSLAVRQLFWIVAEESHICTYLSRTIEILLMASPIVHELYVAPHPLLSAFLPPSCHFRHRMCPVCLLEWTAPLRTM